MRRAIAVLLSFALASLPFIARAQGSNAAAQSRPSAVSATVWVPITRNLGFVIEQSASGQNSEPVPSLRGYFVAKRNGDWLRLDSIPQTALLRWPLTSRAPKARVPIASNLAFVVEQPRTELGDGQTPVAMGYFVTERGDQWVRLDPMVHGTLFSGPLSASRSGIPSVLITADLRFVIEQPAPPIGAGKIPSALGYFVLGRDHRTIRLDPIAQGALFRTPVDAPRG